MIPEAERAEALAATLQAGGTVRAQSYPSQRVRAGLGLVPRRVPGLGELWRRPWRATCWRGESRGCMCPIMPASASS
jgi:hypothetical protein